MTDELDQLDSVPASWREILASFFIITVVILIQMLGTRAFPLLSRPLWLDEIHTLLIVSDPSFSHAMTALKEGCDTNPPGLHILLRGWCAMTGGVSNTSLRTFSLLVMCLGLTGLYASLRNAFNPLAAAVGVAAICASPLVVRHAFEARFYGPFLATAVWFQFLFFRLMRAEKKPVGTSIALAMVSIVLCTVHYFGIVAVGLIVAAEWFAHRPSWRQLFGRALLPVLPGPAALALAAPFYFGQRRPHTVSTWVRDISPLQQKEFVVELFAWKPLLVVAIVLALSVFLIPSRSPRKGSPRNVAGLYGLFLFAPLLFIFSLTVQPALISRYAIPAVAATAALAGWAASRVARPLAAVALVAMLTLSTLALKRNVYLWADEFSSRLATLIDQIRHTSPEFPIVFVLRQNLYPVCAGAPDLRDRCFYFDTQSLSTRPEDREGVFENEMARVIEQHYGWPHTITWAQLRPFKRHILVGEDSKLLPIRQP